MQNFVFFMIIDLCFDFVSVSSPIRTRSLDAWTEIKKFADPFVVIFLNSSFQFFHICHNCLKIVHKESTLTVISVPVDLTESIEWKYFVLCKSVSNCSIIFYLSWLLKTSPLVLFLPHLFHHWLAFLLADLDCRKNKNGRKWTKW